MQRQCCRICDSHELCLVVDLGATALANRFVRPSEIHEPEPKFPLRLMLCEQCGLVQIDEELPTELLFRDYIYVSGTSASVQAHARALARNLVRQLDLHTGDLVLEVASNDGTVLKAFQKFGVRTLGIEPARNIARQANEAGIETLEQFFNARAAHEIRSNYGPARLILARHVLAHVPGLHDFVSGLEHALAQDGVIVVEVPHLLTFFDRVEYDTIYHEHLSYFSLRVLKALFERHGLQVVDVKQVALHGGSILVTAQRQDGPYRATCSVGRLLDGEERSGLHNREAWRDFAQSVARSRESLLHEIDRASCTGHSLAGYGAPAKGMTLLAYCGIDAGRLGYIVDRSTLKHGRLTPGHHIPIYETAKLLEEQPAVTLLLAWNFAEEVVRQQSEYIRRGGRFLIPIPTAHYWK